MPVLSAEGILRAAPARPWLFLDARSGPDARDRFEARHVAGSRHLRLDEDLAAVPADPRNGGRHPFPTPEAFAATLSAAGIRPEARLAVFDDRDGANAAARLYVMLRAIGHSEVAFVDGGLDALARAGVSMATGPRRAVAPSTYPAQPWAIPLASMEEVEKALAQGAVVLDARSRARFAGEAEPFDPPAGHVPGAQNLPYTELLDPQGLLLGADELSARFAAVAGTHPVSIVHCGSGVTACLLMVAMEHAGIATLGPSGPKLWVGSYSEWSRNDKPIALGQ